MSHAVGTYLGGVRSVECLRQRSHVDEETGCWHWRLGFGNGTPRVYLSMTLTIPGRTDHKVTGSTAAYLLSHGLKAPPKGRKAYRECGTTDCVNPEHIVAWTREQHGAWVTRVGRWKNQPRRMAANRANKRKNAKLDPAKAREIRQSTKPQQHLARLYCVPQSTIWAIKQGKLWKEGATNSSVFAWAGAA